VKCIKKDASGNKVEAFTVGITNFTDALTIAAPNATTNVSSLAVVTPTANGDAAIVPKVNGAFLLAIPDNTSAGGNKRGTHAVDLQTIRSANTEVASGNDSFAAGRSNEVSGPQAIGIGFNCISSSSSTVAIGEDVNVSAPNGVGIGNLLTITGTNDVGFGLNSTTAGGGTVAVVIGNNCTANAASSNVQGRDGHTFAIRNRRVFGLRSQSADGDSQISTLPLAVRTTGNTATTLVSFQAAEGATNQLTLQNNQSISFEGIVMVREKGATGNYAKWKIEGILDRGANAASTVLTGTTITTIVNVPGYGNPTLAANTTLGSLRIQVTGLVATDLQWMCRIETEDLIYA